MDELSTYLSEMMENPKVPDDLRVLAQTTLEQWNQGITPSMKTLDKLRKVTPATTLSCTRMEHDGACAWLRKYGKGYSLPVPPIGEKATCCFGNMVNKCPGYRK